MSRRFWFKLKIGIIGIFTGVLFMRIAGYYYSYSLLGFGMIAFLGGLILILSTLEKKEEVKNE